MGNRPPGMMLADDPHLIESGKAQVTAPPVPAPVPVPSAAGIPRFTARGVRIDESTYYVIVHESTRDTRDMFSLDGALRPDAQARCFVEDKSGLIAFYERYRIPFTPRSGAYILYCLDLVRAGPDEEEEDLEDIDENFEAMLEAEADEADEDDNDEDEDELDPGDRKDLADAPQPDAPASTIIDLGSVFGGGGAVVNRQKPAAKAALVEAPAVPKPKPDSADSSNSAAAAAAAPDSPCQIGRQTVYYEVPPGYVTLYVHMNDSLRPSDRVLQVVERQVEESRAALAVVSAYLTEAKKAKSAVSFSGSH